MSFLIFLIRVLFRPARLVHIQWWWNLKVALLATAMAAASYAMIFDRVARVKSLGDRADAFVVGQVVAAEQYDTNGAGAYQISDPTGRVWVVTSCGVPEIGSIQAILLKKEAVPPKGHDASNPTVSNSNIDPFVCVERMRFRSF